MKVLWSESALEHLTDVFEYISRDSERYALRMIDRITSRSKQISYAPESGQVVRNIIILKCVKSLKALIV